MITLLNGCWISDPTVYPSNWMTLAATVKKDWYIQYYFHDPVYKDKPILKNGKLQTFPNGYYRRIKGMNHNTTLGGRQKLTKAAMADEIQKLKDGWSPITGGYMDSGEVTCEIHPTTPFAKALKASFERLQVPKVTKYSIKSCLKYVTKAIEQLRFNFLDIQAVRRRHIKLILEQCEKNQDRWSPQSFNHYRAYLMMMFKELVELDSIELNPVTAIPKKPVTRKKRQVLTDKERELVDEHLLKNDPRFRMFLDIFFHSGSRIAEIVRVKGKHVDMENQRVLITVEKGKTPFEVWKPMKNLVYDYWGEVLKSCGPDDYVFSHGIMPGKERALPEYFTKRWKRVVKDPLGITADLYSLKHSNMEETAKIINIKAAQKMASHTSEKTSKLYAQGENAREDEDLKLINNPFFKKNG